MQHSFQPVELETIISEESRFGDDRWALLTSSKDDKVNSMTISWGGVGFIWSKHVVFIFVRSSRYTKEMIDASDTFSVSFLDMKKYRGAMKYLGAVSGRDEDKLKGARLNIDYDEGIPYIDEAKNVVLCEVLAKQEIEKGGIIPPEIIEKYYSDGDYHTVYIAEIKKIMVR
ncbi:MAG: flavin reductase [Butyrivibrio sp.]|nr:flavin reductase [Butyrivibrio sp.]